MSAKFPELIRKDDDDMAFAHISVNDWIVSIQASRFHYCTPRVTLPKADDYDAFEVAAWPRDDVSDGEWLQPREYPKLAQWAEQFDRGYTAVAGYMPRNDVAEFVAALSNVDPVKDRIPRPRANDGGAP